MGKPAPKPVFLSSAAVLHGAVSRAMRPLVGLLIEHGLTYPWLNQLLKSVFVDVADKEFRLTDKRQTDSRITLLTGIHRKDIRRLRAGRKADNQDPPASVYLGAQVAAIWISDERFLDAAGHPRPLPRLSRDDTPSFEELVTSINTDIRPRAILDEWLRLGAVEVDEDDFIRLKTEAFVPSHGFEEKAYYLGRNVHDHLAAARHNVQSGDPPFLERSVFYDELSVESAQELEALARVEGMKVLQQLNRRARQLQAADRRKSDSTTHRINFGIYFYREQELLDPDDSE